MADKVFTIQELPTGVRFEWTRGNRAAPRGDWSIPLTLRTVRDDLPGSTVPVEQVLGWNFEPFELSGEWDDRYLGAGSALSTYRAFEALVKRGSLCRFEFEQQTVTGLITNFTPKYKRPDRIAWSFRVSAHERPSVEVKPQTISAVPQDPATAVDVATTQTAALRDLHTNAIGSGGNPPAFPPSTSLMDDVRDSISNLETEIEDSKKAVDQQLIEPQAILRLGQRFVALRNQFGAMRARFVATKSTTSLAFETAVGVLSFDSWSRYTATQARLAHRSADDSARDIRRRAKPGTHALYRPYKGESVYGVSQRFYNTPHEWRRILDTNRLTIQEFQGTELLIIPAL